MTNMTTPNGWKFYSASNFTGGINKTKKVTLTRSDEAYKKIMALPIAVQYTSKYSLYAYGYGDNYENAFENACKNAVKVYAAI